MNARALVTPVVLVVLAVGAAAYAYFVDRHTASDADRVARRRDVFPSFRVEDVGRIQLDHGDEVLVLERNPGGGAGGSAAWTMTSPKHAKADVAAVDALLRELELATWLREVDEAGALGMDAPRARGKVTVGAIEVRFAVGGDAPRPEGGAYIQVGGEGTFVVGRSLKVQLLRGADAYRDRTLVPVAASDVGRVEVRVPGDGRGFTMDRQGATFRIAGTRLRASRSTVEHLFAALADARITTFLPDALAGRTATASVSLTLAPRDANRPSIELRVGDTCPGHPDEVVVTLEAGDRGCTTRTLVAAISPTQDSLVDRSPFFARADEIEQIRLESPAIGGAVVDVARKGNGWHERSPTDRDLDRDESDSANNLALALADARALDARPADDTGRPGAHARVSIVRTGGGTTEVVEIGAPGVDGDARARRLDDGALLTLPRAIARRFEPHPVALRRQSIWRSAFDAGAVVAVDNRCSAASEQLELRGGTWVMRAPAGFAADAMSIADLTSAIAHTKADAWVAEKDDGTFGFDRPGSCQVTLTLSEPQGDASVRHLSVAFGAEGDGGVYARALDDPAVFVASRVVRDLASRPAIDRSRLRVDPGSLASITIERGADRLTLERAGERLVRRGADEAGIDDRLEAALAGFSAQSAVHIGRPARDEGMDRPTLEITAKGLADGGPRETHIAVGALGRLGGAEVYFARAAGVDATFAVPRRAVSAILDAW